MRAHKRGDVDERGFVFWQYGAHYPKGEFWTSPEKFVLKLEKQRLRKSEKYNREKENILGKNKKWRENNPEKLRTCVAKYYVENREKCVQDRRNHYKKNSAKYQAINCAYVKKRRKEDPLFALSLVYRNRLAVVFKGKGWKRPCPRAEMVGCSFEELKSHIERQFLPGMSWENRGMYGWHVDHIKPLSSAKTPDELLKLCHYSNLQPLWAFDNLSKGKK